MLMIDAKENCNIAMVHMPNASVQTKMDKNGFVAIRLEEKLAELLVLTAHRCARNTLASTRKERKHCMLDH